MNYWTVAPAEVEEEEARDWKHFIEDGVIAIGYDKAGVIPTDDETIKEKARLYENSQKTSKDLRNFRVRMAIGDKVVALGGQRVYGFGEITGDYCHDGRIGWGYPSPNLRDVRWEIIFDRPIRITELDVSEELAKRVEPPAATRKLNREEYQELKRATEKLSFAED